MRLSATRLSATGGNKGQLPFNKFISALLSKSGRVAAYYGESWDEILAYNAVQVAAGTPANCVAFEDSAGTIPLVAPLGSGKGCGLLLDRSLGLVRGPELAIKAAATTLSPDYSYDPVLDKHVNSRTASNGAAYTINTSATMIAGKFYEVSFDFSHDGLGPTYSIDIRTPFMFGLAATEKKYSARLLAATNATNILINLPNVGHSSGYSNFSVRELPGNHRIQTSATARGEMSRRVNRLTGTETLATQSIATVATNSILSFSGAGSITLSGTATGTYSAGTHTITTTVGTLTLTVSGTVTQADCRYSADAGIGKTYQRVTSASDYDEEGFPARWTVKTDDWSKSSINPIGANRAFVLTALRVNSSATLGVLAEYGPTAASTDGTFSLESLSSQITLRVRGASAGTTVSASVADSSYVVIGALIDLASPRQELFINGVSAGVSTAAIGSTTFVARDLFVAARNGASSFANADSTAPLMAVFMQPGDPGLTSAEISRLTAQFKKSIKAY